MDQTNDMTAIDREFGARLRAAREAKNMSQTQLAEAMRPLGYDVTQQMIYKIESGQRKVTVGEATALAKALDLRTVLDLTRGEGSLRVTLLMHQLHVARDEYRAAGIRLAQAHVQLARNVSRPDDTHAPVVEIEWLRDELVTSMFDEAISIQELALDRLDEDDEIDPRVKELVGSAWQTAIDVWEKYHSEVWSGDGHIAVKRMLNG